MRVEGHASGWRAVVLIAIIYVYFLIFAQFAFLARLAELGIGGDAFKLIMASMAAGGILLSLVTPRAQFAADAALRLRIGFGICAAAALLTLGQLNGIAASCVAFLIGAGLGITTVTLVTHLRTWSGERGGILNVGFGTAVAYFLCNVPAVFTAGPTRQALIAAGLCVAAMMTPLRGAERTTSRTRVIGTMPFLLALFSFAMLIWFDSAAFYIIQHTTSLKAGTWMGNAHLWTNGGLHFAAAIVSAVLLARGRVRTTLALAFTALGFACLLLQHSSLVLSASLFYPVGVSLYSVALVAYPPFLTDAESIDARGRQAGWIYAVAGWIGSALGIGMAQNLGHVPLSFVALAGFVVLGPAAWVLAKSRPRELVVVGACGLLALIVYSVSPRQGAPGARSAAQRGRQVYISEGCISCHSQYVRPNSPDVAMWGPVETLDEIRAQRPPLIGNRRQGPDLAEVGSRRSRLWLKAHLVNPAELSYRSPMPPFAFLFHDNRGDDLVEYLASLRSSGMTQRMRSEAMWQPGAEAWQSASVSEGAEVYERYCGTCHDPQGPARLHWKSEWNKQPSTPEELRGFAKYQPEVRLAQVAKFGVPGTDMPGHEYLNDRQIASVALWIKSGAGGTSYH